MAHIEYHNNLVELTQTFYQSHLDLIRTICIELEQVDKIKELQEKFLDKNKIKAKKDPNRPNRAKTSYLFFCEEMRTKKEEFNFETNSISEQSKLFGSLWQKISKEEKQKYTTLAENDKIRYEEEMQNYTY